MGSKERGLFLRGVVAVVAAGAAGYANLYRLGRGSGSTASERSEHLPGDELIVAPTLVTNHAAHLPAPPETVWPWLTQVGWHRGGWYTPRWVDRILFPGNWPSADRLEPSLLRELKTGDTIPDGPPGTAHFVVEFADAPRLLVLHSRTHLPPGWDTRFGASLDWVWTFTLREDGVGTRMLIRNRGIVKPAWLDWAYRAFVTPADHVMTKGMFRGLAHRVGAGAAASSGSTGS